MVVGIILFLGLVLCLLLGKNEDRERVKTWKKDNKKAFIWSAMISCTGLWLHRIFCKALRRKETGGKELFEDEIVRKSRIANTYGGAYLLAIAGAVCGIGLSIFNMTSGKLSEIHRPEFGETTEVQAIAEGVGGSEEISILISGRTLSRAEMDEVFDSTFRSLQEVILNGNSSFSKVCSRLSFPSETDSGIRITYESQDTSVLSNYGTILAEELPDDGVLVNLKVTLRYEECLKEYEIPVKVCPEQNKLSMKERIEAEIKKEDEVQKDAAKVILPSEIDGEKVTFAQKSVSGGKIVAIFLLVSGMMIALFFWKEKEKQKKREEDLELSYGKLVAKYVAYLDAGLSIRNSWLKIVDDYRKQRIGGRPFSYVYEEMILTANEMNSGKPESLAYGDFGRRCGNHIYVKFSNLLTQNLKQGVSGLKNALKGEVISAQEARKNAALKKGEEAGTKQLFPMLLMLGVVIVALVVPVFMSF